ncbi:hypothetical protein ACX3TR_06620 [Aerococcus mictus]
MFEEKFATEVISQGLDIHPNRIESSNLFTPAHQTEVDRGIAVGDIHQEDDGRNPIDDQLETLNICKLFGLDLLICKDLEAFIISNGIFDATSDLFLGPASLSFRKFQLQFEGIIIIFIVLGRFHQLLIGLKIRIDHDGKGQDPGLVGAELINSMRNRKAVLLLINADV